jgi:hypothetical protein
MSALPKNIVVRPILVTDLSQQLRKQRNFLKWMARRYEALNPEQSAAFAKGAELLEDVRQDLLDGLFDAEEEVFIARQRDRYAEIGREEDE